MTERRKVYLLLGAGLALTSCTHEVTKDQKIIFSDAAIATYAPNSYNPCKSKLPDPTDFIRDPDTHKLNIPFCDGDDATTLGLKAGLRQTDGYAVSTVPNTKFTKDLDAATLAGGVFLRELATGAAVDVTPAFDPSNKALYIKHDAPLSESTTYVAVITNAVTDTQGNPVVSDQVFTFARSRASLIDELGYSRYPALSDADANELESLRLALAPMFDALEKMPQPIMREDIAVAWTFTTQTVWSSFQLIQALAATGVTPTITHETSIAAADHPLVAAIGIPVGNLCELHTGHVVMPDITVASGTMGKDEKGWVREVSADYLLTTPNLGGCSNTWDGGKLAIFVHGLGRCKNDALGIANTLAQAGWATLTVDGPRAGARTVNNLGDKDMDSCADQGATPELLGFGLPDPFTARDQLRQWALEISALASLGKSEPWTFAGLDAPGTPPTTKVAVVGHSWGGIAAALAGSISPDIDAVAINAASAEFGAIFQPSLQAAVADVLTNSLGVDISTPAGKAQLDKLTTNLTTSFRWALEPTDLLYAAPHYSTPKALVQVVTAGGADVQADVPLHETDTQINTAEAFGEDLSKVTYTLTYDDAGTTKPMCKSSFGTLGALLQPCGNGGDLVTAGMQRQILMFITAGVVCSPDITVSCP